ncbi:MAG: LamG domain-containing protein [Microthrixaceae bacterium]
MCGWADGFPELEVHTSTGAIAVQGSTRVAVGEAHHLVGTYDGSHVRIFVDGVLSAVQTKTGLLTGSGPFWIGKNSVHGYPFDGAIDEVAVYDSVLSPTQVTAHYQAGRGTFPMPRSDSYSTAVGADSPRDYWRLGESPSGLVTGSDRLCRAVDPSVLGGDGLLGNSFDSAMETDTIEAAY